MSDPVWTPILRDLHASALDCLQTSFALLADAAHGAGTHLALGAARPFRDGGRPATPDERAAQAEALLGLRVDGRWLRLTGPQTRRLAEDFLYVSADAFDLPWCPYAGHEHMRHSFLARAAGDEVTVVDAYHNDTAWGEARPGVWRLTAEAFDAALEGGAHVLAVAAGPPPRLDPDAILAGEAERQDRARPAVEAFLARTREALGTAEERLVLDVWLLGREQQLHEDWLASVGRPTESQRERWQQLAARTYLAQRRGRPNAALVDELAELLGALDVETAVLTALRETLDIEDERLRAARTLRDLPGFNSFRLVDVIERVEHDLGVTVPGDALTAENLRDVGSLCAMFATAGRSGR
ncbi:acyl carrier protein [Dactylosporangium sucinum]|uniref:Carrier domain-containing protein n=1 Tax=Dactylosporangium sucinum TaxID=1424081 RepID=A0A917U0M2_9ACTN|nr:acyl carrier protein [Dactylosporangium sucinum]GGM47032.1 hypothetical protein GCM10007977_055850 [Dactylosporangium sucinum]